MNIDSQLMRDFKSIFFLRAQQKPDLGRTGAVKIIRDI